MRILDEFYGKVGIRVAFKPMSWKGTMMEGVKDKLDEGKRSGVGYEIVCGSCNKSYIGETRRSVETCVKEYFALARNSHPELSAVAEHVSEGQELDKRAKIVEMADSTLVRRIKTLIIHSKDKNGKVMLNRDKGVELSSMWLDLV